MPQRGGERRVWLIRRGLRVRGEGRVLEAARPVVWLVGLALARVPELRPPALEHSRRHESRQEHRATRPELRDLLWRDEHHVGSKQALAGDRAGCRRTSVPGLSPGCRPTTKSLRARPGHHASRPHGAGQDSMAAHDPARGREVPSAAVASKQGHEAAANAHVQPYTLSNPTWQSVQFVQLPRLAWWGGCQKQKLRFGQRSQQPRPSEDHNLHSSDSLSHDTPITPTCHVIHTSHPLAHTASTAANTIIVGALAPLLPRDRQRVVRVVPAHVTSVR